VRRWPGLPGYRVIFPLACYAGAGFDDALREEAGRHRVLLVGPDQLYGGQ
jgi:hypothetical protein